MNRLVQIGMIAFSLSAMEAAAAGGVLIRNVTIVDGTGAKPRAASVRIEGGTIAAVGRISPRRDDEIIDGKGLTLAPGFIDTHSHHDRALPADTSMLPVTSQGVTTLIIGQDGYSQSPLASFYEQLARAPAAVNIGSYSGHNTLRAGVMGQTTRDPASADQIAGMSKLLESDMAAGAFGLSTGLIYEPGVFSTREEVLALAKVSAAHGGRYISHLRNEAFELQDALDEAIRIGRETRAPVQVSHLKIGVKKNWGQAGDILRMLNDARAEGIDITADIYPYTYWMSTMRVMFPNKVFDDRQALAFMLQESTPPEKLYLAYYEPDRSMENKTLAQIAAEKNQDAVTAYIELMQKAIGYQAQHPDKQIVEAIIGESMHADDVDRFLLWPHTNICSDGFPEGHPRGHGTFTRVLGNYVRERKLLPLEAAVHKMTGLAAQHLGIKDRGVIRKGARADLVLFDPARVIDKATLQNPKALSEGIERVWVNGQVVYQSGAATAARPGQIVRAGR